MIAFKNQKLYHQVYCKNHYIEINSLIVHLYTSNNEADALQEEIVSKLEKVTKFSFPAFLLII